MTPSEPTLEQRKVTKELARRRVFIFFFAFTIVALANVIGEESDIFLHALDDYAIIALSIVAIALLAAWWKRKSLSDLKMQDNVMLVITIVALAFQIFAFQQEINDPTDFGNEIPSLLLLITILINRFV